MKYKNIIISIIFTLLLAGNIRAQIEIFTDRTIYATGEEILFSVFLRQSPEIEWSRVIYLNLISPDGTTVAKGKYPLSSSTANGSLKVPDQLLTGNYYLVAYTRWMQNFSPANYEYKHIRIINPTSSELEPSCLEVNDTLPFVRRPAESTVSEVLDCITERTNYRSGEKINISFRLPGTVSAGTYYLNVVAGRPEVMDSMLIPGIVPDLISYQSSDSIRSNPDLRGFSLSGKVLNTETGKVLSNILEELSAEEKELLLDLIPDIEMDIVPDSISHQSSNSIRFIPDLRGLSLSGIVVNNETGVPLSNIQVELTVFEKELHFQVGLSGEDGSFVFALDSMTGSKEMYISARDPDAGNVEIRVDNDFTQSNFSFFPRPFILTESERDEATRIMLLAQIRKSYQELSVDSLESSDQTQRDFYGFPSRFFLIDDYIQLPTLNEIIIELVPGVRSVTRNKKHSLRFFDDPASQKFMSSYEPLILIDRVSVHDIDKLLSLSPQKLNSIEVISELYYLGNITYGGIINITSKNGDMAGMDLPQNSFFFDFITFHPQAERTELHAAHHNENSNSPVLGNTLLWNPELKLVPGRSTDLSLTAPDRPGRYLILVRGLSADGSLLQGRGSFIVE